MVQEADLGGIEEAPAFLVQHQRIVVPGVPQALDHINVFGRAFIPFGMGKLVRQAEIGRFGIGAGGDQIPARAPAAQLVERGELPRHMVGRHVGAGNRGDQADPAGMRGQRGQQRQRFPEIDRRAVADRLRGPAQQAHVVGEEHRVELGGFRLLREFAVELEAEGVVRIDIGMAPGGDMVSDAVEESAKAQLPWFRHGQNFPERVTPQVRGSPRMVMIGVLALAAPNAAA